MEASLGADAGQGFSRPRHTLLQPGDDFGAHLTGRWLDDLQISTLDLGATQKDNKLTFRISYALKAPRRAPGKVVPDDLVTSFPASTPLYLAINDAPFFWQNHSGPRAQGLDRILDELGPPRRDLESAAARFSLALTGLVERGPGSVPAPSYAVALQGDGKKLERGLAALLKLNINEGYEEQHEDAF